MERLTFLIDSLNRAAEHHHATRGDPDIKVEFKQKTTTTMPSVNDMEVILNVWVEYSYYELTVRKALIKSLARVSGSLRSKKLRDKRPVRSVNDYHAHADLIGKCYDELVRAMVLGIGDWSFRKIITGDAVIEPLDKCERYYNKTFNGIIKEKFVTHEKIKP